MEGLRVKDNDITSLKEQWENVQRSREVEKLNSEACLDVHPLRLDLP